MEVEKAIKRLQNMQEDRKSFAEDEQEMNSIFMEDYEAIETVLNELQTIKQDRDEWKMIVDTGNKREYKSKFLKEFKKEYGKNVEPDGDEIYKRYDEQKRIIKLKDTYLKLITNSKYDCDKIMEYAELALKNDYTKIPFWRR